MTTVATPTELVTWFNSKQWPEDVVLRVRSMDGKVVAQHEEPVSAIGTFAVLHSPGRYFVEVLSGYRAAHPETGAPSRNRHALDAILVAV